MLAQLHREKRVEDSKIQDLTLLPCLNMFFAFCKHFAIIEQEEFNKIDAAWKRFA